MAAFQNFKRKLNPSIPAGEEIADVYVRQMFQRCRNYAGKVFVAEIDDSVVGYACIWTRYRGDEIEDGPENYARSCGITRLFIGMLAANHPARSLCQKLGFQEFAIQPENLNRLSIYS
ncbi:MAG: GNAT family N-acetyltransferase [Cyanobacteria bacterium J06642_2]